MDKHEDTWLAERFNAYVLSVCANGRRDLYSCYKKPSADKKKAWRHIHDDCYHRQGMCITVVGYNAQFFNVGYIYHDSINWCFRYFNAYGNYAKVLSNDEIKLLERKGIIR